jgi:hypothetical protein
MLMDLTVSLNTFLLQHVEILYWVKQVAYWVMPDWFASWLFNLPCLIYFPVRIAMSGVISYWAFKWVANNPAIRGIAEAFSCVAYSIMFCYDFFRKVVISI